MVVVYICMYTLLDQEEEMQVPPWLEPLLSTSFFRICSRHKDAPRNECNMFCLDCISPDDDSAFCFYCRSSLHKDHLVIQIRRSSYHDVVRVSEIQKVLDISEVQTYVINSARVLFLNERPQQIKLHHQGSSSSSSNNSSSGTKGGAGGGVSHHHLCQICNRTLLDPFRFCSLGCKVVGVKKKGEASRFGRSKKVEEDEMGMRKGEEGEELREARPQGTSATSLPNSRRRKGVPHRAPFAS